MSTPWSTKRRILVALGFFFPMTAVGMAFGAIVHSSVGWLSVFALPLIPVALIAEPLSHFTQEWPGLDMLLVLVGQFLYCFALAYILERLYRDRPPAQGAAALPKCAKCGQNVTFDIAACPHCGFRFGPTS